MTDPIDSLAHLDPEPEELPIPEERKSAVKRRQPEWNALRRRMPEEQARVVRDAPSPEWMKKPLGPPNRRAT